MALLAGDRVGRWTVVGAAAARLLPSGQSVYRVHCRCDCGNERDVAKAKLASGASKSCGCLQRELARDSHTVHGGDGTPERIAHRNLIVRCTNPRSPSYPRYGGRGITVCERWLKGDGERHPFECFLADMGPRPSPDHSVDRVDVNGDYEPSNCRWATTKEQARNRRSNRLVEVGARRMSVAEACDVLGIRYATMNDRLQSGWAFDDAVTALSPSTKGHSHAFAE